MSFVTLRRSCFLAGLLCLALSFRSPYFWLPPVSALLLVAYAAFALLERPHGPQRLQGQEQEDDDEDGAAPLGDLGAAEASAEPSED